jgi:NAD(P)-dependent dehydrogenase (short-subunit alcohol dehydrogenase family)
MIDENMVYVVIGATGTLGSELSRQLSDKGAKLLLAGRDESKLNALANSLPNAETFVLDARETSEVEACIQHAADTFGKVDGIANCVGSLMLKPGHLTSDEEWQETIAVNLTSAFGTLRGAVKAMRKTGGSVVFVSSAAARTGLANHEAIAAAKAGVSGLTLSAAATYAKHGIRVNAVAPGLVESQLTERLVSNEASKKASLSLHALDRVGQASDIASMISWLLDPANDWVTGQVFGVDGGLATVKPRLA